MLSRRITLSSTNRNRFLVSIPSVSSTAMSFSSSSSLSSSQQQYYNSINKSTSSLFVNNNNPISCSSLWFQFASCSSSSNFTPAQQEEVADVANIFLMGETNKIPLGKIIHGVSPATKSKIFKSGKGLEGYLRQFPSAFSVEKVGNDKFLLLLDEKLKETCKASMPKQTTVVEPPISKLQQQREEQKLKKQQEKEKRKQEQLEQQQKQKLQPFQSATEKAEAKAAAASKNKEKTTSNMFVEAMMESQFSKEEDKTSSSTDSSSSSEQQQKPKLQPFQSATEKAEAKAAASKNKEKTTSSMFVDAMMESQFSKEEDKTSSSTDSSSSSEETTTTIKKEERESSSSSTSTKQQDAGDMNPELTSRVKTCCPGENQWYRIVAIHQALYQSTVVQVGTFVQFLKKSPKHFWVDPTGSYVCRRLPYHTQAPPNLSIRAQSTLAAGKAAGGGAGTTTIHGGTSFHHQWGEQKNAPTSQDVFEILRYIPIHWSELGSIQIPDTIKKKHIRIASKLTWFAKQPKFFDLRWIGGTCEVRRAPVLHPTEHGLTKEEAEKLVLARLEEDARLGQPLVLMQARGISPAGGGGQQGAAAGSNQQQTSTTTSSSQQSSSTTPTSEQQTTTSSTSTSASAQMSSAGSTSSAMVDAVSKALIRIAPGYFVTSEAIMRRATKKMTDDDIALAASKLPLMIDRLVVTSKNDPKISISLYRRKIGVVDSTWKPEFIKELEESSNLKLLKTLMTHLCAQWDRTHFLYVRLPDNDKVTSGGFDEMVEFLRKHPQTFRVGEYFVKRNDLSDPANVEADPEPTSKMVTTTKQLEDNPYHQLIDLATVFHYLTPENDSVSLSHFVDSSSPAMRSVLPPRILTILQAYPEKFTCREIAPGTFAVSRTKAEQEEEDATLKITKEEAVEKLIAIIPPRGVDIAHVEATMPQPLRRAILRLFGAGGVSALVGEHSHRFHIVRNPPYQTIFVRK